MAPARSSRNPTRALVVAVHDVAPPFETEVRAQLATLTAVGVRRRVLKVVPNWHGGHPLPKAASLVDLLQAELASGSELVLHGLEHRQRGALRGRWADRLRAVGFAGGAAEFLALTAPDATRAALEGLALFAQAGLPRPQGFCAPAWLIAPGAEIAIRELGFRRLIGMFSVRDLRTGHRRWLPSSGYMGTSRGQEAAVGLLNALVRVPAARASAVKVYLHPQGNPDNQALRQTLDAIATMVHEWRCQPTTYAELCDEDGSRFGASQS